MKHLASTLTIAALALFGFAAQAEDVTFPDGTVVEPRFTYIPMAHPRSAEELAGEAAAGLTIPLWSASVKSLGRTYKHTMAGQNPQIKLKNPATTIPLVIQPVKFLFANGDTLDPSVPDPKCSPAGTPLGLFQQSPMLKDITFASNGKNIVTGQYSEVFQFANFYKFTKSLNPHFSITLQPKVLATQTVRVTASFGTAVSAKCGKLGEIEVNTWSRLVESQIFPALNASLTPTTIPLFLFYNVIMFNKTMRDCCILGYHTAFANPSCRGAFQTFGVTDYDTSQAFGSFVADVASASHEINELQDDPNTVNPTPPWGHVGQVSGCQANLEVADPLSPGPI